MSESGLQAAQRILAESRRLRSTGTRVVTAAKLRTLVAEAYDTESAQAPESSGVTAYSRWQAAKAIAALRKACDDISKPVPDHLWVEVDRTMIEWIKAER